MSFDLAAYLSRIGLDGCSPDLDGLVALQRAQMSAIPFEAVGPFLGRVPDLAPEAVWRKLVERRLGGYCFELNGLFGRALAAAGFAAWPLLGRVRMGAPVGGIRAHLAWIVTIDGRDWLADAGFGGPGPFGPLQVARDLEQRVAGTVFRLRDDPQTGELVLERRNGGEWLSLFGFDESPFAAIDVESANYLCTRWAQVAPFSQILMLSRAGAQGAISLMNRDVREIGPAGERAWTVGSAAELDDLLRGRFGLAYDRGTVGALWAKLTGGLGLAA